MKRKARAWTTARLLCAAATLACVAGAARAQQELPELDPSAPLDPMEGLEVEWPDLNAPDLPPIDPAESERVEAAEQPAAPFDASAARRYEVRVEGLDPVADRESILAAFDAQSALREFRDEDSNAAQIDRRSRADSELLAELLRSIGYYDASVEPRIAVDQGVATVVIAADPGGRYRFESVELPGLQEAGEEAEALRDAFAVKAGDPVVAQQVIDAGLALRVALGESGFASADVGEREIVLDPERRTARLVLPVRPGPAARFGSVRVTGSPPFPPSHVMTIARFEPGDLYQRSKVDDLRRALIATGLVASADIAVTPVGEGRTVDLAVALEPAPMRTIAGELGYGTGDGLRAEASWQHRNFINPEGALTLRGVAGTREQVAAVEFRRSNFRLRDQTLTIQALASNVDRDAYEAKTALFAVGIERLSNIIWQKAWTWGFGLELIATDERGVFADPAVQETRTFGIAALPLHLHYDGTEDLLNPVDGFRLGARFSPELSAVKGGTTGYAKIQLDASAYRPVSDKVVLAGRVRAASIVGAGLGSLAPSRRLYSGGGGSVRGYGYQKLGPKDSQGDPIGGRGLAEFALEARIRPGWFGGNLGIVPFLDGGTLSTRSTPDFGRWQFGAGIGLRYYSSFGPIRLDVGTPLNRRDGDAPVAVVVSLGQAF